MMNKEQPNEVSRVQRAANDLGDTRSKILAASLSLSFLDLHIRDLKSKMEKVPGMMENMPEAFKTIFNKEIPEVSEARRQMSEVIEYLNVITDIARQVLIEHHQSQQSDE